MVNHNITDGYSYDTARDDDFITFYYREEGQQLSDRQMMKIPKAFFSKIGDRIALDKSYEDQKATIESLRKDLYDTQTKLRDSEDLFQIFKDLWNDMLGLLSKQLLVAKQRECHCQEYDRSGRW
jgi:hypothetical protein